MKETITGGKRRPRKKTLGNSKKVRGK